MRGQSQASPARLGSIPARDRIATWADARVRKRQSEQVRQVQLAAAAAAERRRVQRSAGQRPNVTLRRLPY